VIEEIQRPARESDIEELARLLVDAVESGASVSFMASFTVEEAKEWWRETLRAASPRAVFVVARDGARIVGTVQMHPAWAPNQPHRGDIAKLLVHTSARRHGIGRALMERVEEQARRGGFTLLTLDTARGDGAESLYRSLGWTVVGVIPDYALYPDARPCDTVVFYKRIDRGR
jgi:GNAT superfamily N-acetyltransferase